MRLVITPLAEQDIESIGDYIARNNPCCWCSIFVRIWRFWLELGFSD